MGCDDQCPSAAGGRISGSRDRTISERSTASSISIASLTVTVAEKPRRPHAGRATHCASVPVWLFCEVLCSFLAIYQKLWKILST